MRRTERQPAAAFASTAALPTTARGQSWLPVPARICISPLLRPRPRRRTAAAPQPGAPRWCVRASGDQSDASKKKGEPGIGNEDPELDEITQAAFQKVEQVFDIFRGDPALKDQVPTTKKTKEVFNDISRAVKVAKEAISMFTEPDEAPAGRATKEDDDDVIDADVIDAGRVLAGSPVEAASVVEAAAVEAAAVEAPAPAPAPPPPRAKLDVATAGVLIVDHGSRRAESNEALSAFAALFRATAGPPYRAVAVAHMEIAPPTIADGFAELVAAGCEAVVVAPYFLSAGRHWREDIPRLAAEAAAAHGGVPYMVAAPLGVDELLVRLMQRRIEACAGGEGCAACEGAGGPEFCALRPGPRGVSEP